MTAKPQTGPDDKTHLAEQQKPSPEQHPEAIRIAALLRDRFGTEH